MQKFILDFRPQSPSFDANNVLFVQKQKVYATCVHKRSCLSPGGPWIPQSSIHIFIKDELVYMNTIQGGPKIGTIFEP